MCVGLRTVLLLAVALALAAHPLLRSLSLPHLPASTELAELQVIICTAHGAVVIDESPVPQPGKESSSCQWCTIENGSAGKLAALTTTQLGDFYPPQSLKFRIAARQLDLPSAYEDWAAHAPRGPPCTVSA